MNLRLRFVHVHVVMKVNPMGIGAIHKGFIAPPLGIIRPLIIVEGEIMGTRLGSTNNRFGPICPR
jgi:hypothetical protein